jgi:hypothetical protein
MNDGQGGASSNTNQPVSPLIVNPYAARTQPIIEADAEYKQAVARDFATKLQLEKRRAFLHKVFMVEIIAMAVLLVACLVSMGSEYRVFLAIRMLFMVCWVAVFTTAAVQIAITAQHKSKG